jgi:hypothetical protein
MDRITSSTATQDIPLRDGPAPTVMTSLRRDSSPPAEPRLNAVVPEHDETLLVAALEEIEHRRLAIETLVNAGLLTCCLADQ